MIFYKSVFFFKSALALFHQISGVATT